MNNYLRSFILSDPKILNSYEEGSDLYILAKNLYNNSELILCPTLTRREIKSYILYKFKGSAKPSEPLSFSTIRNLDDFFSFDRSLVPWWYRSFMKLNRKVYRCRHLKCTNE